MKIKNKTLRKALRNKSVLIGSVMVLIVLFSVDMIHSHDYPNTGKGITDYAVTGEEAPGGISQEMP